MPSTHHRRHTATTGRDQPSPHSAADVLPGLDSTVDAAAAGDGDGIPPTLAAILEGAGLAAAPASASTRRIGFTSFELQPGEVTAKGLLVNDTGGPAHWERAMLRSTNPDHAATIGTGVLTPDQETVIDAAIGNIQHFPITFDKSHVAPPDHIVVMGVRNRSNTSHTYSVMATMNTEVGTAASRPGVIVGMVGAAVASGIVASAVSRTVG